MKNSKKTSKKTTKNDYEQKVGELTDHLQRLQAEFENYKKRQEAEKKELLSSAKLAILTELLPALDNFDRASHHIPKDLENNSWAQGMQYVGNQLWEILEDMNVKKFNPLGQEFDHNEHEAAEFVQSEKPEGIIVEVITPGYQIGEKVVRPASVKVSSGPSDQQATAKDEVNRKKL